MKRGRFIAGLLAAAISIPMFTFNVSALNYLALYVATDGSDDGNGTIDNPFATIERARDEIRNIKKTSGLPDGGVCVYLRGGEYQVLEKIEFTEEDSGAENIPITYRAYRDEDVQLIGGINIKANAFKVVNDKSVLEKLPSKDLEGKILEIDLGALGLKEVPETRSYGAYQGGTVDQEDKGSLEPAVEFFIDGTPQTIARWPNDGYETYDAEQVISFNATYNVRTGTDLSSNPKWNYDDWFKINYTNPRAEVWFKSGTALLYGYWDNDWADYTLKIHGYEPGCLSLTRNQFRPGGTRRFYVYNLIEELDKKGEYFIDRNAKKLYWYPVDGYRNADMKLSIMTEPLIDVKASYLNFKDFDMGCTRGSIFSISGDHNTVSYCTLHSTGAVAVSVSGRYNGIVSNYIYDVTGGITLNGGDQKTLLHGENYAENNYIKDFARLQLTYCPAIAPRSVGERVTNNTITGSSHLGIEYSGPEHIIEYNDFFDILRESDDAGAIYSGRRKWWYGNILRYNYIHDMGSNSSGGEGIIGIYLDDSLDAAHVYGNIFANYKGVAIQATGSDGIYEKNLSYNIGGMVRTVDWSTRREDTAAQNIRTDLEEGGVARFAVTEKVWLEKYPQIKEKLAMPNMQLPQNNVIKDNVTVNAGGHSVQGAWSDRTVNNNQVEAVVGAKESDIIVTEDGIKTINSNPVYSEMEDFPELDSSLTGVYAKKFADKFKGRIVLGINKGGALSDSKFKMIDEQNDMIMPFIENDRTMVPVRFISENLGALVDWNQDEQKVTISSGDKKIELVIGEAKITVNGEKYDIDAPAMELGGRTFVPIRVISENLGRSVHWDEKGLIVISSADDEFKTDEFPAEYEERLINEALRQIDLR